MHSATARGSAAARPPAVPGLNAPSLMLPLAFVASGLLALAVAAGLLIGRPDILATYHYNQYVIAVTHLVVLGWITTVVMGAMYQLVPVALETRLHSETLARWQFLIHVVSVAGMVWMFWKWDMKQVGHFGAGFALGVALFVYNLARTLCRVPRWTTVATSVGSALVWLAVAVTAGLAIAAGKCTYDSAGVLSPTSILGGLIHALRSIAAFPARFDQIAAMHAHAHLGALGVFLMLIVGVSYKLVPMFTLGEIQGRRRAALSIAFLNAGLAGSFFAILLRNPWKFVFALVVLAGLALYAVELRSILRSRKRRPLDWGLKSFLIALGLLVPLSLLALVLSQPGLPLTPFTGQLENLYGYLGFFGVVSLAIIGMLHKIVPFLVWYAAYSRDIGLRKVPALADLSSARLQVAGLVIYLAGLAVTSTGILLGHAVTVRTGCVATGLSLVALLANMGLILRHLYKPWRPVRGNPSPALKTPACKAENPSGVAPSNASFALRPLRPADASTD